MKVRILEPSYILRREREHPNVFLKIFKRDLNKLYTKQRRDKKETMSHTQEGFRKSGPHRASLISGEEGSYSDSCLPRGKAPHPWRTEHRAVLGAHQPSTLAWRKCFLLLATPKARVPGAARVPGGSRLLRA